MPRALPVCPLPPHPFILTPSPSHSYSPNLRENDWDPSQWIPLIDSNKTLLPWLVKQPTDAERGRARHVSKDVVQKLEDLWHSDPEVTRNVDTGFQ